MGDNPVLLFWLAVFGLGLIGMAYKWWEWRRIHAGLALPGRHETAWRNLICSALTAGAGGVLFELLNTLSVSAPIAVTLSVCGLVFAAALTYGLYVDRRNGRAAPRRARER